MEVFGANAWTRSSSLAKTIYAGCSGSISRITTKIEPIWGWTKKRRWNGQFRIDLPHPLDSLSCLESAGYTTDTNGVKPHDHYTIY